METLQHLQNRNASALVALFLHWAKEVADFGAVCCAAAVVVVLLCGNKSEQNSTFLAQILQYLDYF